MVQIYSCEGNIGAGKTTLLTHIENITSVKDGKKIVVLREPVDIWTTVCDKAGQNILENFYRDPVKYAFPFQVLAFTTRLNLLKNTIAENPECKIIICERSLYADGHIFAKMLYDDGLIDYLSYQIYTKMYDNAIKEFPLNGVLYLTASPDVCANRITKRNRSGEENIKIDYLRKCADYHEAWLGEPKLKDEYRVLRMDEHDVDKFMIEGSIWGVIEYFAKKMCEKL
jgi:deoxyadenosine/deoxycytidine kinase